MFFSEYYSFSLELVQMLQIVTIKLLLLVTGVTWTGALSKTSVENLFATPAELMQLAVSVEELVKLCCYYTLFSSLSCLHHLHLAHRKIWFRIWQRQRAVEQHTYLLHFLDLGEKLLHRVETNQLDGPAVTKIDGFSYYCQNMLTDFALLCWPCCILLHILQWWHQPRLLCVVMCK